MFQTVRKKQAHITIDEILMKQAQEFRKRAGLSLSSIVSIALFEYLKKEQYTEFDKSLVRNSFL